MAAALTLLRGLAHRAGTTVVILLVALCASAAATIGPTYYEAAKTSILRDTLSSANVVGTGFEASKTGGVAGTLDAFRQQVDEVAARDLGSAGRLRRLFQPAIESLETTSFFSLHAETVPLAWRTGVCAHLRISAGRCFQAPNEVVASPSLLAANNWRVGQVVKADGRPPMRIVGRYDVPDSSTPYWFARGEVYFPVELPSPQAQPYDALFTSRATIEALPKDPQGADVVAYNLAADRVTPDDVDALARLGNRMPFDETLTAEQVAVTTALASTAGEIHASWSTLEVPVVVVSAELLVLTWLLLFLVVTDAVDARGPEIALAKLRGYGATRALVFALGEPVAVLAFALPAGALLGWVATAGLAPVLLRDGTPVGLPGLGWAAAALAFAGGLGAVVLGARRTLTRPVVEEWRRTGRRVTDRSWVLDAVVLTGAVAGLVQLALTGSLGSAHRSALALLVPGLLGLAVAVVGSRLLPLLCRAAFARTRRRGGLGAFLAVRHIARRPGGTRTTMILATAVALATFSIVAWSAAANDRLRVARVTVGAPTVFTVVPSANTDLAAVVDRIDPNGGHAAAVESFNGGNGTLVAVQPQRFAAVANWHAAGAGDVSSALGRLHPPAPPPVVVDGAALRIGLDVRRMSLDGVVVTADVVARGDSSPTPVALGSLRSRSGAFHGAGDLSGCPCTLRDLQLSPPAGQSAPITGAVTLTGLAVRTAQGWQPLPHVTDAGQWQDNTDQNVVLRAEGSGLQWSFVAVKGVPPTLLVQDRPDPLPAVTAGGGGVGGQRAATGLDGDNLTLLSVGHVPTVPGAGDGSSVVDLDYAARAAFGNVAPATAQVWVRGDPADVRAGLSRAHIPVTDVSSSAAVNHQLSRQGPGLASVLFLADACAAAILAGLAAILSLTAAARRRRYEYAALAATGAEPRVLFAGLALEQLVVVGFGAAIGIGAGLLAAALAGRSVPEFVVQPAADLVGHTPSWWLTVGVLLAGVVVLLATAALAAAALLRSVTPDQLREGGT